MTGQTIVLILIAVVAVAVVAYVVRSRRANDGVDSFKRQIEALSPEARKPVVDQVQNAAEKKDRDEPEVDPDDEDGVRGA